MALVDRTHRAKLHIVDNPPHRWREAFTAYDDVPPPPTSLELYADKTRTILSKNDSPDIPFTYSVNPYRGCYHGCAYCYARPTHEYLDFGAGTDFERKLVYKPDAAKLLREAFDKPSWKGERVVFSGNTDCYQPLEHTLGLTRACLEVCRDYRNPAGLITKGTLIERDIDVLRAIPSLRVTISIPFFDKDVARAMEPYVPSPARRFETIRVLAEAGIPVGVNVAPIIPGLSDEDVPRILEGAYAAGARYAGHTMLRLPGPVEAVFLSRLRAAFPLRAERVVAQIEDCRGGQRYDPRFGTRMRGTGARWEVIEALFEATARKLGFGEHPPEPERSPFRRPSAQPSLFGD